MTTESLNRLILRYKTLYTITALTLGAGTVVGGWWLGHLDGYHTEAKGLLLHVFGCAILYNDNNMYPSLWLMVIGLLVVILTQYRAGINRKAGKSSELNDPAVRAKFLTGIAGLFSGLVLSVYGLTFAESGRNLCPAALVPDLWASDFSLVYFSVYLYIGALLMVGGIVIIAVTRFRIRTFMNATTARQADG